MYEKEYSMINIENKKLNDNITKEGDSDFETIPSEEEEVKNEEIDIKKLRNKFQKEISKINFNVVNCCENYAGNYDNYVFNSLKGIAEIRKVNFDFCELDPNYQKNMENFDFSKFDKNKKNLILDLDETLIHADFNEIFPKSSYDKIIKFIPKDEDEEIEVGIFIRNGINEFFTQLSKFFNIIIFTASSSDYADAVLDYLDPEKKFIKLRLYRENCININDLTSIKDLRIIKNIDLAKTIIVDNSMYSFSNQLSNGILINSFYNDKNDNDLFNVMNYLLSYTIDCEDVREINENIFKFESILKQIKSK
jgi:Dullard-like phosphatase family protein